MATGWDQSKFDASLARYIEVNKTRTLQRILNTKGFYISRGATRNTRKADKSKIQISLGRVVTVNRVSVSKKKGTARIVQRKQLEVARNNSRSGAPLAALIIQSRAEAAGKRSPFYGKSRAAGRTAMDKAIQKMIGGRERAVAFIKSGYLPAVKAFAPLAQKAGAPPMDDSARQVGRAKGEGKPAVSGFTPQAIIINSAFGNRTTSTSRERALDVGRKGLQRSFDDETKSMDTFMEKMMKPDADKFNQEQH